jgi:hypothetical protein
VPAASPQPPIDPIGKSTGVRYSDVQYSAGLQDTAGFANGGLKRGEMLQAVVAHHEIEGRRRKRHAGRVGKHVGAPAQPVGLLQIEPDHEEILPF